MCVSAVCGQEYRTSPRKAILLNHALVPIRIAAVTPLLRHAPLAAASLALAVLLVHAALALASGTDLNHVSGVWLALALDADAGLFYRGLADRGEYGGTRYFPLLFLIAAGGMRLGLPPVAAGQVASLLGAGLLAIGAFRFLMRHGVNRELAAAGAVLALAPYFVQHGILSIRAEPLAAGLALWGAASVADRLGSGAARGWAVSAAAAFTLAVAAKPTSAYAAAAAVTALVFARRGRDAAGLAVLCAAGWGLLIAAIWFGSSGRAIESFRTGALAGETWRALLDPGVLIHPVRLVLTSNYLTVVLVSVLVSVALSPGELRRLPGLFLVLSALAAAAALATPGTILTNQIIEPYVAAGLYLVWIAHSRAPLRSLSYGLVALLLIWAASQHVRQLLTLSREGAWAVARAERAALATAVDACGDPLLSESPLLPVFVARRPLLLDPFAFRVAAQKHPALGKELAARLERREFSCVVLELDPRGERGRGWYRNVHLGEPVVDAVLENYAYRRTIAGRRFYAPIARREPAAR